MLTRLQAAGSVTIDLTQPSVGYGLPADIILTTNLGGGGWSHVQPNDNLIVRRAIVGVGMDIPWPADLSGGFRLQALNAEPAGEETIVLFSPFLPGDRELDLYFAWPTSYTTEYEIMLSGPSIWPMPMIGVPATLQGTPLDWYIGIDVEHTQELT